MSIELMYTMRDGLCHSVSDLQEILRNSGYNSNLECVENEFHLAFHGDVGIMRCSIDQGILTFITFEVWDFGAESNSINKIMILNGFEDALADPS